MSLAGLHTGPNNEVDNNVYIRSMATRGVHGGLNRTAVEVADILDASGKDYIIFETVGVGQSEIEIYRVADVTVVVLSPESGDSIQAMKSGLMEIADIIAVNKSDLPGVDAFVATLKSTIEISHATRLNSLSSLRNKHIPIVKTQANQGVGIEDLVNSIENHLSELDKNNDLCERRRRSLAERIKSLILCKLEDKIDNDAGIAKELNAYVNNMALHSTVTSPSCEVRAGANKIHKSKNRGAQEGITPYELADKIIKEIIK